MRRVKNNCYKKSGKSSDFSNALSEREQALAQDLAAEEQELSRSAEDAIKQMEENYSSKKEQTIQKIIERVISEYGSQ